MLTRAVQIAFAVLSLGLVIPAARVAADDTMVFGDARELEAEMRIRQALRTTISLDFNEASLKDAAAEIERLIHYPIALDIRGLDDAGCDADTQVSFQCRNLAARDALALMLRQLDLAWTNRQVILITTPEVAAAELVERVYPVEDLVTGPGVGDMSIAFDYDSLIEQITTVIYPTTWDEVGGPGSIAPHELTGTLSISQTREVHERIEVLLHALRAARDWQGIPRPDIDVSWRQYFSEQARQHQRAMESLDAQPAFIQNAPTTSPAQVAPWQRPRVYE